jgi:hypothetical protein
MLKIQLLINEDVAKQSMSSQTTFAISYVVCLETLTENLNMRRIAPSSRQRARPHVPENHRVRD